MTAVARITRLAYISHDTIAFIYKVSQKYLFLPLSHDVFFECPFYLSQHVKSVHLIEQLHQSSLNLSISARSFRESSTSDGINLIHEDDAGLVVASIVEHLTDKTGALADVLVYDGGGYNFEEVGVKLK